MWFFWGEGIGFWAVWGGSGARGDTSYCAPNQSFGLFRCSAWLIFHEQSTGLFIPKRSCSRASPLRERTEPVPRPVPVLCMAYSP